MMIRHLLAPLAIATTLAVPLSADASLVCRGDANSVGPGASLRWNGAFNTADGTIVADGMPANTAGFVIYGFGQTNTPLGDGTLCVSGVNWILARKGTDASGKMSLDVDAEGDFDDLIWLDWPGNDEFVFQYMYRDPSGGPAGFNLSSAVRVSWE